MGKAPQAGQAGEAEVQGSIRKRGEGSWELRVSLGREPGTGRYRYVHKTVHGGKREAQRALAQLVSEVDRGHHQHTERHTLAELIERWMKHLVAQGRAPGTLERYRSAIDSTIVPALGHIRIDRLTGADIDAFYAALAAKGRKPTTIRKSHAILSASLRQAVRWGWLDQTPMVRATPPSSRVPEVKVPTVEEVRRLLEKARALNPDLYSLLHVAATTGLRRGELGGLRWEDVDFESSTLTVRRSASDTDGIVFIKDTKTHAARRLALDPITKAVLQEQRQRVEERAAASEVDLLPHAYIWSQELDGSEPYRPNRMTSAFITLRARVGLEHVTLQSFRHFAATALAGKGVGIRTIAGRLGHVDPNLTLRTYAHFLDVADREAAVAMEGVAVLISPAAGSSGEESAAVG